MTAKHKILIIGLFISIAAPLEAFPESAPTWMTCSNSNRSVARNHRASDQKAVWTVNGMETPEDHLVVSASQVTELASATRESGLMRIIQGKLVPEMIMERHFAMRVSLKAKDAPGIVIGFDQLEKTVEDLVICKWVKKL